MHEYKTRTNELGKITFTAPAADETYTGYVWMEAENYPSGNGPVQICYGGNIGRGNAVQSTTGALKETCQEWILDRRNWLRKIKCEGF